MLYNVVLVSAIQQPDQYPYAKTDINIYKIPDGIIVIEGYAFHQNQKLDFIKFNHDGKLTTIGENAFEGIVNVRTLTLPESITTIENNAFASMENLIIFVIRSSKVASCGDNVFKDNTNMRLYIPKDDATFCDTKVNATITSFGETGDDVDYITTNKNELIIYGKENMYDYDDLNSIPWKDFKETIVTIEVDEKSHIYWKECFQFNECDWKTNITINIDEYWRICIPIIRITTN